eukprot:COSAG01_NODE_6061_length_3874_cov_1.743379_5_plen_76_part_00
MPGADFGIVMIVADVAASWGQHSGSGYAPGRPQIGPGKCECLPCPTTTRAAWDRAQPLRRAFGTGAGGDHGIATI